MQVGMTPFHVRRYDNNFREGGLARSMTAQELVGIQDVRYCILSYMVEAKLKAFLKLL